MHPFRKEVIGMSEDDDTNTNTLTNPQIESKPYPWHRIHSLLQAAKMVTDKETEDRIAALVEAIRLDEEKNQTEEAPKEEKKTSKPKPKPKSKKPKPEVKKDKTAPVNPAVEDTKPVFAVIPIEPSIINPLNCRGLVLPHRNTVNASLGPSFDAKSSVNKRTNDHKSSSTSTFISLPNFVTTNAGAARANIPRVNAFEDKVNLAPAGPKRIQYMTNYVNHPNRNLLNGTLIQRQQQQQQHQQQPSLINDIQLIPNNINTINDVNLNNPHSLHPFQSFINTTAQPKYHTIQVPLKHGQIPLVLQQNQQQIVNPQSECKTNANVKVNAVCLMRDMLARKVEEPKQDDKEPTKHDFKLDPDHGKNVRKTLRGTKGFNSDQIVPDVVDDEPLELLTMEYRLKAGNKVFKVEEMGQTLTPTQVQDAPYNVQFKSVDESKLYTVILTDPDARNREWVHLVKINVSGADLSTSGDAIVEYVGSGPSQGSGLHRYIWLVYEQSNGRIDVDKCGQKK
eukprot:174577_1